jgi:acetyltransferase-like isoleucine patch superfamily enzyme
MDRKRLYLVKPPQQNATDSHVDTDPSGSHHDGISGIYESVFRRFKTPMFMVTMVPLYLMGTVCLGISLTPAFYFLSHCWFWSSNNIPNLVIPAMALAAAAGFFIFGFALMAVTPMFNFVLARRLRPHRGTYYSIEFLPWYIHNGLTYLVRYIFLEFVTPTPFNVLFYRMMGMKMGYGCQINTTAISDPGLIELGNKVTIGGSVTLVAHYGMGGYLVVTPTKIGDGVTLGLRAIIMGGAEIGAGAKVLPNSVVLPKTRIPPGEIWGGVPASKISLRKVS